MAHVAVFTAVRGGSADVGATADLRRVKDNHKLVVDTNYKVPFGYELYTTKTMDLLR